jgi:alcohol dehydrogenase (cytochrome c)
MTRWRVLVLSTALAAAAAAGRAQERVVPAALDRPPTGSWPTFNGDYSGRRYSPLAQITTTTVKALSLAWLYAAPGGGPIKSTPLMIDGVLYVTTPDHAYAVDARTGRERWHYTWPSKGGNHLSNRGLGALGETLYMETPDCHLVALNLRDGTRKWDTLICEPERFYYASTAPVVIGHHLMTGVSGDDMDNPGYLDARDPDTGALQWRWYSVPQKRGDPGSETWPNEEVMKHGGGMTWQPVTYDPALRLVFVTTGNPQPVAASRNREGANLFTASIVALDVDTGKMAWHFQASPHDTHDWDATETAVLFDGDIDGRPRRLLAQASRNGYFFVLDRATGQAIVSTEFVKTNWSRGHDGKGQPIPDPAKQPQVDGALVSPDQSGATNWQSPSFSPRTGLFYVSASRAFSVWYLYDASDNPAGWGGTDRGGWGEAMIEALDYRTGTVRWSHRWPPGTARAGILTTGGDVLFTSGAGGIEALDARTGEPLWHSRLGAPVTNAPITYVLDGLQYVTVAASGTVFSFVLNR